MFVERLILSNFRCFGPEPQTVVLSAGLTVLVGANGTGKTALIHSLQRLFGVTREQRRIRRQDFHVPLTETQPSQERHLSIEAIVAFPELDQDGGDHAGIPEFFHQMASDESGQLKCRLRLDATWTDDGSLDGTVEQKLQAIRTFGDFTEADCIDLKPTDRARIQMIYVPALRDGSSQVTAFLRGRLWRAVNWSQSVQDALAQAGPVLNNAFGSEIAVNVISTAVNRRWGEVYRGGTDTTPSFRPVDIRFQEFIRKVEAVFYPDEAGRERGIEDLSDGQRSLFHIAMTAATLDIEAQIQANPNLDGFQTDSIPLPALTMIAVEEPENNLAPFYLSRIIHQIEDLTNGHRAQAVASSHSASILARVDPVQVRHFRIDPTRRTAKVHAIRLPEDKEDASKFIRAAVQTYPELYFARFVVLGEGASEEVVLPRLAEARGFHIDRSFVAVVPLGGRHVNHLWRLLNDLDIPHATLLDLDWGRHGGGWGRIKTVCTQLLNNGVPSQRVFGSLLHPGGAAQNLLAFDSHSPSDVTGIQAWAKWLQEFNVFFSAPLDLDYSMLMAFRHAYQVLEPGQRGPSRQGDPRTAVLGDDGHPALYGADQDEALRWYRYLFLGRSKPSTHVRVLSTLPHAQLASDAPEELRSLLDLISQRLSG